MKYYIQYETETFKEAVAAHEGTEYRELQEAIQDAVAASVPGWAVVDGHGAVVKTEYEAKRA